MFRLLGNVCPFLPVRRMDFHQTFRFCIDIVLADATTRKNEGMNFTRLDHGKAHISVSGNICRKSDYMPFHYLMNHGLEGVALI